jgi:hypothetical protein
LCVLILCKVFLFSLTQHPNITAIQKEHPDNKWYGDLYRELLSASCLATVRRGDNIRDKPMPIRRNLLLAILRELVDDPSAIMYEYRFMFLFLYLCVGRSNELHATNFELMWFCSTLGAIWCKWNQGKVSLIDCCFELYFIVVSHIPYSFPKTGFSSPLPFFPDFEHWELCPFHALTCHLLMAGHRLKKEPVKDSDPKTFVFPSIRGMTEKSVAGKINGLLKTMIPNIEELMDAHTSHGMRGGATDDMLENHFVPLIAAICRGDWKLAGECLSVLYVCLSV